MEFAIGSAYGLLVPKSSFRIKKNVCVQNLLTEIMVRRNDSKVWNCIMHEGTHINLQKRRQLGCREDFVGLLHCCIPLNCIYITPTRIFFSHNSFEFQGIICKTCLWFYSTEYSACKAANFISIHCTLLSSVSQNRYDLGRVFFWL